MISLAEYLNVKIREGTRDKYPGYIEYVVSASKVENVEKFISYLDKYSLFSSKYLNYQDYKKVFDIVKSHKHKTTKGIEEVRLIRENSKRTNWDHLLNFYKLYELN